MPKVELIFDSDCPNVEPARQQLREAFSVLGLTPQWTEWLRMDPTSPDYVRQYGSPTILIDGKDIAGSESQGAESCRIYQNPDGSLRGVPSVEAITSALSRKTMPHLGTLAILPAIGVALMPKLVCPACWPAYAALVSALGLGFLISAKNLFIVSTLFLGLALIALFTQGRKKQSYRSFWLGLFSVLLILFGKFALDNDSIVYGGVLLLTLAAILDFLPQKKKTCLTCETDKGR